MATDATISPSSSPIRALLGNRSFTCVWAVGGLSGIVRWLQLLVLGIYTYQITGSPLLVSVVPMLFMLPLALFGPLAGVVADRVNRKLMITVALAMVVCLCIVTAVIAATEGLGFTHVMVVSLLSGLFWAIDMPVRRRLLGDLSGDALATAMSLDSATANATRMSGPLLGGVMLEAFSITGVFVLSAVIFAICLVLMLAAKAPQHPPTTASSMFAREFLAGVRFVLGNAKLRRIFAITIIFNVWGFPFTSMIPIIGSDRLGLGPFMVGVLSSTEGLGAVIGAIVIAFLAKPAYFFPIFLWGSTLQLTMVGYFGVLTYIAGGPTHSLVAASGVLVVIGMGGACFAAMQGTLTYLASPPEYRSRVLGVLTLCIGTGPIGFFNIGWMAESFGVSVALIIDSLEGLTALLLLWVFGQAWESEPDASAQSASDSAKA